VTVSRSAYIPQELLTEQPYSMCPTARAAIGGCEVVLHTGTVGVTFPALGGSRVLDAPEAMILSCLWAEPRARRAALARGLRMPLRPVKGMELVWQAGLRPGHWRPVPAGLAPAGEAS
jgi:hypothetical protein